MSNSVPPRIEKDVFKVEINIDTLLLSRNEVLCSLGYSNVEENLITNKPGNQPFEPDGQACLPDNHFLVMIDDVLSHLNYYCKINAGYRIVKAYSPPGRHDGLYLDNIFFRTNKIVAGQLRKSEKAALFVCSIGPDMENWAKQLLLNGEYVLSYIVNNVASLVVEKAVDFLHEHISGQMKQEKLKITNRYSPGYCDWSVSEQHLLFSLLPINFCDVSLNEFALMLPIKSISGVIGIGPSVRWKEYICDKCNIKDCTYRMTQLRKLKVF